MMSWHENGGISPGTPDLHYVMGTGHQVGWLELKSKDREITKSNRIQIEPSQHQYIRKWLPYMPIHFLIRANKVVYLVEGKYASTVAMLDSPNTICSISVAYFPQEDIRNRLPALLKTITRI